MLKLSARVQQKKLFFFYSKRSKSAMQLRINDHNATIRWVKNKAGGEIVFKEAIPLVAVVIRRLQAAVAESTAIRLAL